MTATGLAHTEILLAQPLLYQADQQLSISSINYEVSVYMSYLAQIVKIVLTL